MLMENKLEQLFNSLIQKGWNVFWHKDRTNAEKCNYIEWNYYNFDNHNISISLRELVSKESQLWQFVCEMSAYNNYNKEKWKVLTWKKFEDDKYQINWYSNWWWYIQDYEYRLIESSLKDESELEEFLLSNIVIKDEWESKKI